MTTEGREQWWGGGGMVQTKAPKEMRRWHPWGSGEKALGIASSSKQPSPLMPVCPTTGIIIWMPRPKRDGKTQAWGISEQELPTKVKTGKSIPRKGTSCTTASVMSRRDSSGTLLLAMLKWRSVWRGCWELNQEGLTEARHWGAYGFRCQEKKM